MSNFSYRLVKCADCGFVKKISDVPSEDLYKAVYDEGDYVLDRKFEGQVCDPERGYIVPFLDKIVRDNERPPRVLEVGPGSGRSLLYCRERGCEIHALDVSSWNRNYYSNELNIEYVCGTLEDVPENYFDGVILTHVIEHIEDPVNFMKSLFHKLSLDGRLLCSTPNIHSLMGRLFGQRYWVYRIDDHFSFFRKSTLALCTNQAGGEVNRSFTVGMNVAHSFSQFFKTTRGVVAETQLAEVESVFEGQRRRPSMGLKGKIKNRASQVLERIFDPFAKFGVRYELVVIARRDRQGLNSV